jgi:TPR repeat protein
MWQYSAPSPSRLEQDREFLEGRSMILAGYANALYRLGWRYEAGLGTSRNSVEALRCYHKSAKLGNLAALARLGSGPGEESGPADPPCG